MVRAGPFSGGAAGATPPETMKTPATAHRIVDRISFLTAVSLQSLGSGNQDARLRRPGEQFGQCGQQCLDVLRLEVSLQGVHTLPALIDKIAARIAGVVAEVVGETTLLLARRLDRLGEDFLQFLF